MKKINFLLFLTIGFILTACQQIHQAPVAATPANGWKDQFDEQLALNGHRNWILVVDKAFPQQPGMHIINTGEKLLPVLETVLQKINASTHVRPIVFNDAELQFLTDSLAPGVGDYKANLKKTLGNLSSSPLLHDTVFVRMDAASKLFSVTVLKTEEVIPYSSVFIQLDCAYWGGDKEKQLRQIMQAAKK